MARRNRRDVLIDGEIQIVHCVNRCVRRAFLCGKDSVSGKNYDHRREMIRQRLEFLAGIMGIEVLGYAVMSNHFHCILRSRHDIVETWSDEQIALKWWMLCPVRKNKDGSPAEPTELELKEIRRDKKGLKEKRRRLASISWFMRFLSEKVAKEANKQDECSGRFWEGRFKAQVLLDDAAILACMQYVDLNPIRAGIAKTLETSQFTSVFDRIADLKATSNEARVASEKEAQKSHSGTEPRFADGDDVAASDRNKFDTAVEHGARAGWLAPVGLESKRQAVRMKKTERRVSNKGFLALSLAEYLQLLDWTARQIRTDKRGSTPAELEPLFERLQISAELWVDCVKNFRKWFRSTVGRPSSMTAHATAKGHDRAISIRSSRRVFV
ncbi:MAG: transposase [Planctomycetaceae bacterium]